MSLSGLLSINEVNELDLDQFIWLFGNVIEKRTEACNYVFEKRPFQSAKHIILLYSKYLDTLKQCDQEEILQSHPDLGASCKMTDESVREQGSCGVNDLEQEEREELSELNLRYKEKFGFPFVICARQNKADSILSAMKIRLENDRCG
ncbi:hypothetical protein LSTR_LSTR002567 [Laodelphax striatellus]|uniref:2-oxo-4-hydroxy-4-carboxy-5-ureidoimidazoline decarboxylase n=1 Tax=Laodelphax striatellus TaxID=195883 RepID=A0A482XLZ9_LAOST|nr:hypothetical protein LSTR_LSTR002567 [Laodelphax striatellus]